MFITNYIEDENKCQTCSNPAKLKILLIPDCPVPANLR